ncbi:MAG: hypothetical protein KAR40_12525 [Candidatus Sabulitectum sp.]|nr:hypothetical protein [Candidatus Sabulitectum sp.]
MNRKRKVLLRLLGGGVFAVAVFFLIFPALGRNATVGIILAIAGFGLALQGE